MSTTFVVITRFCLRGYNTLRQFEKRKLPGHVDPLGADNIAYRYSLLNVFAAQSLRHQQFKNFKWVVLIDQALPAQWRSKVQVVVAEFNGDIFEYRAGLAIEFNDWIPGLDTARGGRLVTINHDDDDLLPEDYLAGLAQLIDAATADGTLPPVSLAASSHILQWDLLRTQHIPYGSIGPWPKSRARYASTGFSLICADADFGFCVSGLSHARMDAYFSGDADPDKRFTNVRFFRQTLIERYPQFFEHATPEQCVFDMRNRCGPVLMSNHAINVQRKRLYEQKAWLRPVVNAQSLPHAKFNWELLMRHRDIFVRAPAGTARD